MLTSLQKGIEAAKSGQMDEALAHLKDAIIDEPENANVWVWLSAIIEDENKQEIFLKKALEIDPLNRPAQRGLAYIERKKIIPPKPGEKLSDYTKPIGLFRTNVPETKEAPKAPEYELKPASPKTETVKPSKKEKKKQAKAQPKAPDKKKNNAEAQPSIAVKKNSLAWLDIILYAVILVVFIIIGVLVGSTFLNIELPFLSTPTPALSVLPPQEGIYLLVDNSYLEMKTSLGIPGSEAGTPRTTTGQPTIVINTPLVDIENLVMRYEDGTNLTFQTKKIDSTLYLVDSYKTLDPGIYCLIHTLNAEKGESLYWCFRIDKTQ